ncbi:MAG: hypothetical protein OXF89_13480 [Rhodospirillaceae bacterium]|nr:hypothetical protein [Rhodospirillaceae bacterium]MCY4064867.1 hypothetical protein [Rhodospirillaceae bacterium]
MKKPKFAHKSDRTAADAAEPFDTAEEAWFWAMSCLVAREDGARFVAGLGLQERPCSPDDLIVSAEPRSAPFQDAHGERRRKDQRMTAPETSRVETFRAGRFVIAFSRDPAGHAYEADVSDDAGSAAIDHPYGMVVLGGSLTVERPDGVVEIRRRGFVSPRAIPTGRWRFAAGPEGCRYVCTHPRDDAAWARTAIALAAGARSADLSGHDWLLVADGTVRDGSGPLAPETLIDLTGRTAPYRLVAEDNAMLVAIDERPAV